MEEKALQIFNNPAFGSVRVVEIEGQPWFVGKDVATALGYERENKAVVDHVDEDDRKMVDGKTQSHFGIELGQRGGWLINESGMYSLILSSKLPTAKEFKRWVTSEVLPSIRKHGIYATKDTVKAMLGDPDYAIELLKTIKEERLATEQLRVELDQSKEWYTIKRVAELNDVSWKNFSWRKLKEVSADLGYEVKKIFDANYGHVNVYHVKVWKRVYPNLEL